MCFVNDPDWYASVVVEKDEVATKDTRCDECRRSIVAGATVHTIWMQEHEECGRCFNDGECNCEAKGMECCSCVTPDLGETFDYVRCLDCHLFLDAVEAAEVDAGCRRYEARPSLCGMVEDINNGDRDDAKRYWRKALDMGQPKPYLAWLWRKTFG